MKYFQLLISISFLSLYTTLHADEMKQSHAILDRVNNNAAATQSSINKLAEETDAKVTEYRKLIQKTESINRYNQQLQSLIKSQTDEIASLQLQSAELQNTHRDIIPLMDSMVEGLALFLELDIPFLPIERSRRIRELNAMMSRADVTISEKYRRILEAYMIEVDYGNTIEAYEQTLELDGKSLNVEMLRVGRVALIYKTRNNQSMGFWDSSSKQWQALSSEYFSFVQKGLKIARKQTAPDLLTIPVKLTGGSL